MAHYGEGQGKVRPDTLCKDYVQVLTGTARHVMMVRKKANIALSPAECGERKLYQELLFMRLRNIPRAAGELEAHHAVIKKPESQRGHWQEIFGNKNPLHIEIGMGKGRFILNMAKEHPDVNFVGIERYSSVLLRAVEKYGTEEFHDLENIRFVCMDARNIGDVFEKNEVQKIYLNFSDPWPKARHAKRRLTSAEFLRRYETVLPPGGTVEFKTDNTGLFNFSLEQIKEAGWMLRAFTYDLHHHAEMNKGNIMTEYEEKFSSRGNPINKLIAERK